MICCCLWRADEKRVVEVVGRHLKLAGESAVRPDGFAADRKGQGCASDLPRVAHWGNSHHRLSACLLNCFEENNLGIWFIHSQGTVICIWLFLQLRKIYFCILGMAFLGLCLSKKSSMTWSGGCNDGLFSWSELLDPYRDQNNIFKFQAPVLPYMQFSCDLPFVFCYIILWSQVLIFPNLCFLMNYLMFLLWIEMLFCAPSQGAWWLLGVTAKNAAVATWFLQASCWGLWLTAMWTLEWGLAWAMAGTSLAICAAPAPVPHPCWDPALWSLSSGSFLALTAMIICLIQLLGLT